MPYNRQALNSTFRTVTATLNHLTDSRQIRKLGSFHKNKIAQGSSYNIEQISRWRWPPSWSSKINCNFWTVAPIVTKFVGKVDPVMHCQTIASNETSWQESRWRRPPSWISMSHWSGLQHIRQKRRFCYVLFYTNGMRWPRQITTIIINVVQNSNNYYNNKTFI